jgi:hypothetical protein
MWMQLSVETLLSRIAYSHFRKVSARLLLSRMEKTMLIQEAVLTHDGRALVWVAKETSFDGINSILVAVVREFDLVIGVDNKSLEFLDALTIAKRCAHIQAPFNLSICHPLCPKPS